MKPLLTQRQYDSLQMARLLHVAADWPLLTRFMSGEIDETEFCQGIGMYEFDTVEEAVLATVHEEDRGDTLLTVLRSAADGFQKRARWPGCVVDPTILIHLIVGMAEQAKLPAEDKVAAIAAMARDYLEVFTTPDGLRGGAVAVPSNVIGFPKLATAEHPIRIVGGEG